MKTIWKQPLRIDDGPQPVSLPGRWHCRHVEAQNDDPTLWIELDPEAEGLTTQMFYVSGTGHPVEDWLTYVGSCLSPPFVWHVWQAPSFKTPQERTSP